MHQRHPCISKLPVVFTIFGLTIFGYSICADGVWAQVVPDQSTPTEVEGCGSNCLAITGGRQSGRNLFHSFHDFQINRRQTVQFSPSNNIDTIFSRVTGSARSRIQGTLGVIGDADLVLINSNGIFFGRSARLNLGSQSESGGAFTATTASAIRFGAQGLFSTTDQPQALELLDISPSAFLFNQPDPRPITVQSNSTENDGLRVADGQTFRLVGGPIFVRNGRVDVSRGQIELVAIGGVGAVLLQGNVHQLLPIPADDVATDNINLFEGSTLQANGGSLQLIGRNITLREGSRAGIGAFREQSSGTIRVNASETIRLQGVTANQRRVAGFFAQSEPGNSSITAGNIDITTRSLLLNGGAQITTSSFTNASGGNVNINATESVELRGIGIIVSNQGLEPRPSGVFSTSNQAGQSGRITIFTRDLLIQDGATITSRSASLAGDAGDIGIEASGVILLNQNGRIFTTAGTEQFGQNGGNITIEAGLIIANQLGNNDISANAFRQGGRVELSVADGIIGLEPRSRTQLETLLGMEDALDATTLPTNDITSISQESPSLDGPIVVESPDVDPAQQVIALPSAFVTPQLRQRCYGDRPATASSSFINIGQGGLPPSPRQTDTSLVLWEDLRPAPQSIRSMPSSEATGLTNEPPTIMEAQGWIRDSQGRVVLTAQALDHSQGGWRSPSPRCDRASSSTHRQP